MGNVSAVDVGIDVGSTTTKVVRAGGDGRRAAQPVCTRRTSATARARPASGRSGRIEELARAAIPAAPSMQRLRSPAPAPRRLSPTRSSLPFVQEVVANSIAVRARHPEARCAIELGGQDAKIVFFERDPNSGELTVSNMRMNGSLRGRHRRLRGRDRVASGRARRRTSMPLACGRHARSTTSRVAAASTPRPTSSR